MRAIVFTICYNQADILPWFLRHYSSFVDEICVFDEASDDGSRDIVNDCPKAFLLDWPHKSGIDEDLFLQFAYEKYPLANGKYDWVLWVDTDEFVFHPDPEGMFCEADRRGMEVIQPWGINMMSEGLPKDDGQQLYNVCRKGVFAPLYSKPVVFRPHIHIRWSRGKHHLEKECQDLRVWFDSGAKLLHYRYLGYQYTKERNARNLERCGLYTGDKAAAWSCQPEYKGEGSPEWARYAQKLSVEVV